MKKFVSLSLALALTVSLAACGGSSASSAAASSTAASSAAPAASSEAASSEAAAATVDATVTDKGVESLEAGIAECEAGGAGLADASGDAAVTLVFSGASFTAMDEAGQLWDAAVEQLSGGSITVDYHGYNELGADLAITQSVALGDVDIGLTSPSAVTTIYPNMSIFDSYYVINDQQFAYDVMDGKIGDQIASDMMAQDTKILMWCENGWRNLTCNVEVKSMDDLKGLKIRTMENSLQMAAWQALGANPTPMSFGEVFTALQQKTIDGQENPLGIIDSNSFLDVCKYLVMSKHNYTPMPVFINNTKYESLTDAQKAVVDYVSEYVETWERERNVYLNEEILAKYQAAGSVVELDDATVQSFQDAIKAAGVYDKVKEAMTNPELVDDMLAGNV